MQNFFIEMLNQYGYLAVALLIAIENIFPPIPSEVILAFGGFMTTYTSMNVWLVALCATIGSVLGALVLYAVGLFLSPQRLERWLSGRLGHILHLKISDVQKAEGWFVKKGKITVFICRFVPIVRSLISIPAGMSRMKLGPFLLLTTTGTAIWNVVLVWLGRFAGASWEKIAGYTDIYAKIALVVLAIAVIIAGVVFYKKRIQKKTDTQK